MERKRGSPTAAQRTQRSSTSKANRQKAKKGLRQSWSKRAPRDSRSAKKKKSLASALRHAANWYSRIVKFRWRIALATKAKATRSRCRRWMVVASELPHKQLALRKVRLKPHCITQKNVSPSAIPFQNFKRYSSCWRICPRRLTPLGC